MTRRAPAGTRWAGVFVLSYAGGCAPDVQIARELVGQDKVWPRMVELQIEENDGGDFYLVDGIRGIQDSHGNGIFYGRRFYGLAGEDIVSARERRRSFTPRIEESAIALSFIAIFLVGLTCGLLLGN